jgi:hypothetical protein
MHGSLSKPVAGEPLARTIHSASWLGQLVDAATSRNTTSYPPEQVQDRGIELLTAAWDGSPATIPSYSLLGAIGINDSSTPTVEPRPRLQATLGRSALLMYTRTTNYGDAMLIAYPIPSNYPVRLRVQDPATLSGYQRKFIEGLPCGRKSGEYYASADQGGMVLISKPYRDPSVGSGDYYCWAIADTVHTWDAVVVRSSGGYSNATEFLAGKGGFVAALLSTSPLQLTEDKHIDIVTKYRCTVTMRDPAEDYVDGTYIQIQYRNNEWKVVWASCAAITGLTGLAKEPA